MNDTTIQHIHWRTYQWHNNTTYPMINLSMTQQYNIVNDELLNDTTIQHSQWWAIEWHQYTHV